MLEKLADFFLSKDAKFAVKFFLFALLVSSLLGVDYLFRLSDSYITKTKIEQIEKIEELIAKDTLRPEARKELIRLENEVIQRQGLWVSLGSFSSFIQSIINSQDAKIATPTNANPIVRNSWYHNLSSGWVFWLLIAMSPFITFSGGITGEKLAGVLMMDFFALLCAFVLAYLFAFIPVLGHPIVNYILNAILCLGLIGVLVRWGASTTKAPVVQSG